MLNIALKQVRLFHRLKQVELHKKLGLSKSYLSQLEGGHRTVSIKVLNKYSEVFSMPVSSLFVLSEHIECATTAMPLKSADKVTDIINWMEY